jgi:hypothetical protein
MHRMRLSNATRMTTPKAALIFLIVVAPSLCSGTAIVRGSPNSDLDAILACSDGWRERVTGWFSIMQTIQCPENTAAAFLVPLGKKKAWESVNSIAKPARSSGGASGAVHRSERESTEGKSAATDTEQLH